MAQKDSGQGSVKNPSSDQRLKENGGGSQGQGKAKFGDDKRTKDRR
jgi:hypothetical protein